MKLNLSFDGPVPQEDTERNRDYARSLGLTKLAKTKRPPLAVVGGGPSVPLNELRAWQGDIWIGTGAYPWCRENGIDGTFLNIDAQPEVVNYLEGAERAILADCTDPSVFDALEGRQVHVFPIGDGLHGPTGVTAAPVIAVEAGHESVHFFGCDSSFEGQTHAYAHIPYPSHLKVKCDGELFDTSLQLLGQALCLSEVIRAAPDVFHCRSGGLLNALVQDPDYDVVACSRETYMGLMVDGTPLHEAQPPVPYSQGE